MAHTTRGSSTDIRDAAVVTRHVIGHNLQGGKDES